MSFVTLVDRVRADFNEMPGLELTVPQAVRLWNIGMDDCRRVIDSLVDAGFLRWTARRTIVLSGRAGIVDRNFLSDISVGVRRVQHRSVGLE